MLREVSWLCLLGRLVAVDLVGSARVAWGGGWHRDEVTIRSNPRCAHARQGLISGCQNQCKFYIPRMDLKLKYEDPCRVMFGTTVSSAYTV